MVFSRSRAPFRKIPPPTAAVVPDAVTWMLLPRTTESTIVSAPPTDVIPAPAVADAAVPNAPFPATETRRSVSGPSLWKIPAPAAEGPARKPPVIVRSRSRTVGEPVMKSVRPSSAPSSVALGSPSRVRFLLMVNRPTHVPLTRSVDPAAAASIRDWRLCVAQFTFTICAPAGALSTRPAMRLPPSTAIVRMATILARRHEFA